MKNKIDFVILWVDGNDKNWQKEKEKYLNSNEVDNRNIRYRDMDNLQYWFRSVEKFTPWVNKIYFVTWGHIPEWLNINNEKIVVVKHSDFIPKEYLPTFNSNVIDLNLYRIKGLSQYFVYFNDDTFITDFMSPNDFFKNGMPCEEYGEMPILPYGSAFSYTMLNNACIINKYYNKRKIYKKNWRKLINFKYGLVNVKTFLSLPYEKFIGFYSSHLPISFLKSYYEKLWSMEFDKCDSTSRNRFRTKQDITTYIIKQFQILDNCFYPRKSKYGKLFIISNNNKKIINAIKKKKYKMICINDQNEHVDFEKAKKEINASFEILLPNKCSFEK